MRERILITDDDDANVAVLRATLRAEGWETVEAADGAEALARFDEGGCDAVVTDILMPRMDGYRLCKEIRDRDRKRGGSATPVVLFTSTYRSASDEQAGRAMGADAFLRKPDIASVVATLRSLLASPRPVPESPAPLPEVEALREYSEALVRKLEKKNVELHETAERLSGAFDRLAASEESLRLTLDSATEGIYGIDLDGRFDFVNQSALRILGYGDARELVGRRAHDVIHHRSADGTPRAFADCPIYRAFVAGRPAEDPDDVFWRADGTSVRVSYHSAPRLRNGAAAGAVVTFNDVTAERAAEQALRASEERGRALMEQAEDAIFVVSSEGFLLETNHAGEKLLGLPKERLLGRSLMELVPEEERPGVAEAFGLAIRRGRIRGFETRAARPDGESVPVEVSAARIEIGGKALVHAVVRDVSERAEADRQLRKLLHAVEQSGEIVFMTDIGGTITYVNPAFEKTYGFSREEAVGKTPRILRSGLHDEAHYRRFWETILSGATFRGEMVNRARSGRLFTVEVAVNAVTDPSGRRLGFLAVQTDVTERKRREENLRQSEARYRDLFETNPLPIWIVDAETRRFLEVNGAALSHYGYRREEFLAMTLDDIRPPEDVPAMRASLAEDTRRKARHQGMWRHRRKDGSIIDVEVTDVDLPGADRPRRLAIVNDVTERRRAEARVRESEERYRRIVDHTSALIYAHDDAGNVLQINARAAAFLGRAEAELGGANLRDFVAPERRPAFDEYLSRIARKGSDTGLMRVVLPGGESKTVQYHNVRRAEPGGPVVHGVALDVTDRIEAERARRATEERLDRIVALSPTVSYLLRVGADAAPVMRLAWISENVRRVLGCSPDECVGTDWWISRLHPDDRESALADVSRTFADGRSIREYRFRHADGTYRWFRDEQRLVADEEGRPIEIVGSWSDVSERRSLEEQLRLAQKMEAVGRLAGGIAHDFNNLLMIMQGVADVLPLHTGAPDALARDVQNLRHATERGASLTRQLLAFSRRQVVQPEVLDAAEAVGSLARMIERLLGEGIRLRVDADPDAGCVRIDPGQLEQVLLNLVVNARDAMPGGGRLEISVHGVALDETRSVSHADVPAGRYVIFSVSDTGTGIPQEVRPHIFEPFFTTKEIGRGTGLGLATVYGIVREAGGDVLVYSEPGHGSAFKVVLPRSERVDAPVIAEEAAAGGTERLLVVEDEAVVRETLAAYLSARGYRVRSAADVAEALRAIAAPEPIDLLVTDLVLPGGAGRQLAEEVRSTHPAARIVFMSGYSPDADVVRSSLPRKANFLQKPFSLDTLAGKIREVLDAAVNA